MLSLIEGVLAANIFDWGSRACVDLYHKGTIIEIYRMSRDKMQRPWRVSGIQNNNPVSFQFFIYYFILCKGALHLYLGG